MGGGRKKFYAVVRGVKPGIYTKWFGADGAQIQVQGFPGAVYKGFKTLKEAEAWRTGAGARRASARGGGRQPGSKSRGRRAAPPVSTEKADVIIYTDGGCLGNPGPGGYGVVTIAGGETSEVSGGRRHTTNNRMELMACIVALENMAPDKRVVLYTDSKYVVNAIEKGWARKWRANNWMRTKTDPAKNPDLFQRLLDLVDQRSVRFNWVKGHADNPFNERCDELAKAAAAWRDLPEDEGFVNGA
ncbi:MAG: ribonuclease HI [Desulfobacterales bacterium]|nr:ribonuclease HI [Desulfobacterales bacterium]